MTAEGSSRVMTAYKSDFLNVLASRGYVHQVSDADGLDALAAAGKVVGYVGYDCTAPSLHVGHLLSIMMLHWLQQTGNKPIALMGGGTTRVGDPSGRDETRKILSYNEIDANKDSIKGTFSKLLRFGAGRADAVMADNAEWLATLNYIEMLRDVGRYFSINRMLTMDSVRLRLLTLRPLPELARLAALAGQEINEAKKVLATEATALIHGRPAAEAAEATARQTFEEGTLAASLPTVEIAPAELEKGIGVLTAFSEKTGFVASNGEARRQIKAGGLKVNDKTVSDEKMVLTSRDLTPEGVIKLSLGRKRHVLLKPV